MAAPYEAVILAAGRGDRLSVETDRRPKSILPIGPRSLADATETSFLERQVRLLREAGVERVVVVVGYLREVMEPLIRSWDLGVTLVVNPTPEIKTSGSLHSFQFAIREGGVLKGTHQTLLLDADIVYHRAVLKGFLKAPEASSLLVCDRYETSQEEVLVYGSLPAPTFLAKGLDTELTGGARCLGEATGIVKFAPADHGVVRKATNWLLGDPDAPEGTLAHRGFGPARRATEHEELTQHMMRIARMRGVAFSGDELPFMEVDNPDEYKRLREELYPALLEMEA
jgi:choline kinase